MLTSSKVSPDGKYLYLVGGFYDATTPKTTPGFVKLEVNENVAALNPFSVSKTIQNTVYSDL